MTASWTAWSKPWGTGEGPPAQYRAGSARSARERRRGHPHRRGYRPAGALARPRRGARANLPGLVPARPPEAVAVDGGRADARRAYQLLGRDPGPARAGGVSAARGRRTAGRGDSDPGTRHLGWE